MDQDNAESKAFSARSAEGRSDLCKGDTGCKEGTGGASRATRDLGGGVDRADRPQSDTPFAIQEVTGKIIAALIDRTEQRLNEAEECLVWYERQRQQCREELADLRSLIEELNRSSEDS